jgi:hypothetical protein
MKTENRAAITCRFPSFIVNKLDRLVELCNNNITRTDVIGAALNIFNSCDEQEAIARIKNYLFDARVDGINDIDKKVSK